MTATPSSAFAEPPAQDRGEIVDEVELAGEEDGDEDDEFIGDEAFVQFELVHAGKKTLHPGYVALTDETMILTLETEDVTHEVTILLGRTEDGGWTVDLKYTVDGKPIVEAKGKKVTLKKWQAFAGGESKLNLMVDPDRRRAEEIEGGGGDTEDPLDPLGGLQK